MKNLSALIGREILQHFNTAISYFALFCILIGAVPRATAQSFELQNPKDCTEIRLDKSRSMRLVPPYNVDRFAAMCGTAAVSTLVGEYLGRKNISTPAPSPIYMGLQYMLNKGGVDHFEVDKALDVAYSARGLKICPNSIIPDVKDGKLMVEFLIPLFDGFRSKNTGKMKQAVQWYFGASAASRVREESFNKKTKMATVEAIFNDICENQIESVDMLPNLTTVVAYSEKYAGQMSRARFDMRLAVDENLKLGIPSGVNYCMLVLKDPNVNGITKDGVLSIECMNKSDAAGLGVLGHAGTIVGRRLVHYRERSGSSLPRCQYLVRDVFGESCDGYPDDVSASPSNRCEKGQVWVDEDALFINVRDVYWYR